MKTQFIIDLPTLALILWLYFSLKWFYYVLRYFYPNPNLYWRSGYLTGNSALANAIRPEVKELVKNWDKIKTQLEKLNHSETTAANKAHDCKVSGQEQNV